GSVVNEAHIGRAAASNWLIGSRPRISSIVRSIDEVLYIVESTLFRVMYGLMARATVRWASTWSEPFWASSSTTKIASFGQNLLRESPSTTRPSARSLSATMAVTVGLPGEAPEV